jgi:hypothetical protein
MYSGVHWQAPTTLVTALLLAIVAASVHHLLYSHLAGTIVQTDEHSVLGFQLSSQQINLAIGTALTFFVNACLVTAVSTAYTQVLWRTARRTEATKFEGVAYRLGDLDTIFSGIQTILAFWSPIWLGCPLLLLLGLITW